MYISFMKVLTTLNVHTCIHVHVCGASNDIEICTVILQTLLFAPYHNKSLISSATSAYSIAGNFHEVKFLFKESFS